MRQHRGTHTWATIAIAVASLLVLLLAACGPEEAETTVAEADADDALAAAAADPEDRYDASFVGRVEGTDALVGLTPYDGNLLAYVCNGDPAELGTEASIAAWFDGPMSGSTFDLTGGESSLRLVGEQTADGFTGTVTLGDGGVHAFTAVAADADEGLYREWIEFGGERAGTDIGWVHFDGVSTGAAQALTIGDDLPIACRPPDCVVLMPTSTLAQIQCPPRPPRYCP